MVDEGHSPWRSFQGRPCAPQVSKLTYRGYKTSPTNVLMLYDKATETRTMPSRGSAATPIASRGSYTNPLWLWWVVWSPLWLQCNHCVVGEAFVVVAVVHSLAPGRFQRNFRKVIFQLILVIDGWSKIVLKWMPADLTDGKSTLVQVMASCRQVTNRYLNQCWRRSMSPYGVTRPQWV